MGEIGVSMEGLVLTATMEHDTFLMHNDFYCIHVRVEVWDKGFSSGEDC